MEGTFSAAGTDSLRAQMVEAESRPASSHVASQWTPPPRRTWWQAVLAWLGLGD